MKASQHHCAQRSGVFFSRKFHHVGALILVINSCYPIQGLAKEHFNISALELGSPKMDSVDLDAFSKQGGQLPGNYPVDIYINDKKYTHLNITFKESRGILKPVFTQDDFKKMGIDLGHAIKPFPDDVNTPITNISEYLPNINQTFDFNGLRVDINVPQVDFINNRERIIEKEQWDSGVPALFASYDFNGDHTERHNSGKSDSSYLNLKIGSNLGKWHLRTNMAYSKEPSGEESLNTLNSYIQRPIPAIDSVLTIGDTYTSSDVNDGIDIRGFQLSSDESMLPDTMQGFSPIVRGIARTNAKITILQNGYTIDQRYVPPGAFAFNDIVPVSMSSQLTVTVTESDGSTQQFIVPLSSTPIMQREGHTKYAIAAGTYRSITGSSAPPVAVGSVIQGVSNSVTLYGGTVLSDSYKSLTSGIAVGGKVWGALALDATEAENKLSKKNKKGSSWRLRYAKDIGLTGTHLSLSASLYPGANFSSFQDAINALSINNIDDNQQRLKRKIQLDVSQSFWDLGTIFLSAYQQNYTRLAPVARGISAGLNSSIAGISYGISYSRSQSSGTKDDQQIALNIQIPFSKFLSRAWADYGIISTNDGHISQQAGISGSALADNNFNYRIRQTRESPRTKESGSLYGDYRGTYGNIGAGYNHDNSSQQITYHIQGGVVLHEQGITLSQPLGDTIALIRAPGAAHVKVKNNTGIYTDWRGYAIVPYQTAYRKNTVALETKYLNQGVDIQTPVQSLTPIHGSVVAFDFVPHVGRRLLLQLHHKGDVVPFGAIATFADRPEESSIVGDNGEVYLSAAPDEGKLLAKWGRSDQQTCKANFNLSKFLNLPENKTVVHAEAECV